MLKEVNESKRSNCSGGYKSRTLGMDGTLELLRWLLEQDEQDETLKGVNTFNTLKGVNECKRKGVI